MVRGIYTAGSALISKQRMLNVSANNMANVSTPGFKKDMLVTRTFADELAYRIEGGESAVGTVSLMTVGDEISTVNSQAGLYFTGIPLDLGIEGNGYFVITMADGQRLYTRNGQFALDQQGYIRLQNGGYLTGQNGPIRPGKADFTINEKGQVYVDGRYVDTMSIYVPAGNELVKHAEGMYASLGGNAGGAFTGKIHQSYLERSNVDVTKEMTDIMAGSRSYQSLSQTIKIIDQTLQKTVNELGRV